MTVSSPCPPFSTASKGLGLDCDQGCLLPSVLLRCRQIRPMMVLLEQVQGFSTHRHKALCINVLKHVGYHVIWQQVIDAAKFGSVTRLRWLALAVRKHEEMVIPTPVVLWPDFGQLTPEVLDAIFAVPIPEVDQLQVTNLMRSCAMDTTMVPIVMSRFKNASGSELLKARCTDSKSVLPTVMAMYGQQHLLDRSTLERKGYHGHFFVDGDSLIRLLHPVEIQMCHVTFGTAFSDNRLVVEWKHTGNMIACPHALMLLCNAVNMLRTPFAKLDVMIVFDALFQNRLRASTCKIVRSPMATFFVADEKETRDWNACLDHYLALKSMPDQFRLPDQTMWIPERGLVNICEVALDDHATPISQISAELPCEEHDTIPPTKPFATFLCVKFLFPHTQMIAWVDAKVLPAEVIQKFHGQMVMQDSCHRADGISLLIKYQPNFQDLDLCDSFCNACMKEGVLVFVKLSRASLPQSQFVDLQLECLQFDQFGILALGQQLLADMMFYDFRPLHGKLHLNPCLVLAAFKGTQCSFTWNGQRMRLEIRLVGDHTSTDLMAQFWSGIIEQSTLDKLGVTICRYQDGSEVCVFYEFTQAIPPESFNLHMTIAATRCLLDSLQETGNCRVLIKWRSKTVWDGNLAGTFNATTIAALLQLSFFPYMLGKCMRLVHRAKQCCDVTIQQLLAETTVGCVVFQLVPEMHGGTGSKESQRAYIRNSMAATLLEQGFSIDWVSQATESVLTKVGLKQAMQCTQMPPGKQRADTLLKLCEDCCGTIPAKIAKTAVHTAQTASIRAKKKAVVPLNPADYQIEMPFFLTQNDEPLQQIAEIRSKSTGVVLLSVEQALPWIRESQRISTDELIMVIPGHHEFQTKLKTDILHVPCKDLSKRPVILKATVVQLGEKNSKTHVSHHDEIPGNDCCTVAITLWRDDWKHEDWTFISDHTFAFIRQTFTKQGQESFLQALWGRSMRNQKQPTTSQHATSIQVHAMIPADKMAEFLSTTGFNRLWATPKDRHGKLDSRWRILWIEGGLAHLNSQASKTTGCVGMVKSKTKYGLRYSAEDFPKAWAVLFPDKPVPDAVDTSNLFQIQCLPYGCSSEMLMQWSQLMSWTIKPIKALGPNSWLVGSKDFPPEGLHSFNTQPVLIKHLPPRDVTQASPIVAGPQPSRRDKQRLLQEAGDPYGPHYDPWAYSASKGHNVHPSPAGSKDHQGPTETRFQEQEAKISEQNAKIEKIEQALEQFKNDTKVEFQNAHEREKAAQFEMQGALRAVKTELESSLQAAIHQQSNQLNATLGELRSLLQSKPKRGRDDAEDMES